MTSEPWPEVPLADLVRTPVTYGVVKPGIENPNGVRLVRATDLQGGRVAVGQLRTIEPALSDQYQRTVLQGDEVLVSLVGTPGAVAVVPESLRGANVNRAVGVVRTKPDLDRDFLAAFLTSPQGQERLLSLIKGSVQQVINLGDLQNVPVPVPPLDEQRRIAGVLGALDDLIEVNRGLIRDLDAMVQLLGRDLLLDKTANTVVPLTDVAEVSKGYSYKSTELVPGDGWLVNLKNVGRTGTFEARGFKPLTATVKEHQVISNGDVLVAQTDLTQDREVIARPVRVRRGTLEGRLVASLDLAIVRPRPPHTNESIFAVLDSDDFRSHALGYCNGTTVLHMGARALPDYMVPVLGPDEIEEFTARVRPLREAADGLNIEIAELEATRDELLPLLMSGRVRVGEAGVAA